MQSDRDTTGHCVHHRCALCQRLFKSVVYGGDCPDCDGTAVCTLDDAEVCR